jgi:hypothetical protein
MEHPELTMLGTAKYITELEAYCDALVARCEEAEQQARERDEAFLRADTESGLQFARAERAERQRDDLRQALIGLQLASGCWCAPFPPSRGHDLACKAATAAALAVLGLTPRR